MKTTIYDSCKYPWGVQTLVSVVADNGEVFNFNLDGSDTEMLTTIAESKVTAIQEARLTEANTVGEMPVTAAQVEAYLKSEGVLKETETIEDLKTTIASIAEVSEVSK